MARATATLKRRLFGSAANAMSQLVRRNSWRRRSASPKGYSFKFDSRRQLSAAVAADSGGSGTAADSATSGDSGDRNSATMAPTAANKAIHSMMTRLGDGGRWFTGIAGGVTMSEPGSQVLAESLRRRALHLSRRSRIRSNPGHCSGGDFRSIAGLSRQQAIAAELGSHP